jgi:uncharacterized phage protein (TIGR01671 family)
MREIKFRGKRIDNTEWIRGGYIKRWNGVEYKHYIHDELYEYEVDRGTVGQYTGLKDKNGTEIYEGDICNCREYECFGKIEWNEDNAGFYFYVVVEGGGFDEECLYEYADELEVIGNIHDNPELLGGAE